MGDTQRPTRGLEAPRDEGRVRQMIEAKRPGSAADDDRRDSKNVPESTFGVREVVQKLSEELNGDRELIRQSLADINQLQRQELQQAFEVRQAYMRELGENDRLRQLSMKEYGLQTLKWAFLMNAGLAGLILAYVGAKSGQSGSSLREFAPLLRTLWPFAIGCFSVAIAGAAGYFNFGYSTALLPSLEAVVSFVANPQPKWPSPRVTRPDEDFEASFKRVASRLFWTQWIAVGCSALAAICFLYGLWQVLRAVG
jgi:hypothetical protein